MDEHDINQFMDAALTEAKKAAAIGEVPIGAVIICVKRLKTRRIMPRCWRFRPHAKRLVHGGWKIAAYLSR